jgi:uncharacterized protein
MDRLHKYMITFTLAFTMFSSESIAWADFNTGLEAYKKGDYKSAYSEWLPEAEKGDPFAQHMMGFLYASGRGVELKPKQTVLWWRKAAQQGFAPAQYTLGSLYRQGLGVTHDPQKAAKWIERAADAGYPNAQYDIGVMYATGEGVTKDLSTAYMWVDQAADTKGLGPGTFWKNLDKLLTPAQRLEAEQLKKAWSK